jgi:tRNA(Ile)-lysidine synthase
MKRVENLIVEEIGTKLRKNNLFPSSCKILLAISGGADSVCLLHILLRLGYKPELAHANFQLRGQESDQDELFVHQLAESYNLALHIKRFAIEASEKQTPKGIQEKARNLRYIWFEQLLDQTHYDVLMTAHQANDQAETMLYHFIRGSGISGLRGIPEKNGAILRPMLGIEKTRILHWLDTNQIAYREDSSNRKIDYNRNFIRHNVLSELTRINPSLITTLTRRSELYSDAERWIQFSAVQLILPYFSKKGPIQQIDLTETLQFPGLGTALHEWILPLGFKPEVCKAIISAALEERSGCTFKCDQTDLIVFKNKLQWIDSCVRRRMQEARISLSEHGEIEAPGLKIKPHSPEENLKSASNLLYIPEKMKVKKWEVRTWRSGDRFKPDGMKGKSKKLSDYLNECGLSPLEKQCFWVVSCEEEVAYMPGMRKSIISSEVDSGADVWKIDTWFTE